MDADGSLQKAYCSQSTGEVTIRKPRDHVGRLASFYGLNLSRAAIPMDESGIVLRISIFIRH